MEIFAIPVPEAALPAVMREQRLGRDTREARAPFESVMDLTIERALDMTRVGRDVLRWRVTVPKPGRDIRVPLSVDAAADTGESTAVVATPRHVDPPPEGLTVGTGQRITLRSSNEVGGMVGMRRAAPATDRTLRTVPVGLDTSDNSTVGDEPTVENGIGRLAKPESRSRQRVADVCARIVGIWVAGCVLTVVVSARNSSGDVASPKFTYTIDGVADRIGAFRPPDDIRSLAGLASNGVGRPEFVRKGERQCAARYPLQGGSRAGLGYSPRVSLDGEFPSVPSQAGAASVKSVIGMSTALPNEVVPGEEVCVADRRITCEFRSAVDLAGTSRVAPGEKCEVSSIATAAIVKATWPGTMPCRSSDNDTSHDIDGCTRGARPAPHDRSVIGDQPLG